MTSSVAASSVDATALQTCTRRMCDVISLLQRVEAKVKLKEAYYLQVSSVKYRQ